MDFPSTIDLLAPFGGGARSTWFNALLLTAAVVLALSFTAYLTRCYLQEFRRYRRVMRRKAVCRAALRPNAFEPLFLEQAARRRDNSAEEDHLPPIPFGELDCWRLQWVVPNHERITWVWYTRGEESPAHQLYIPREETTSTRSPGSQRIAA